MNEFKVIPILYVYIKNIVRYTHYVVFQLFLLRRSNLYTVCLCILHIQFAKY